MPPATSPTGLHWRTLTRQPWCKVNHGQYILEIMVAKRKGDPRAKWKRVSSAAWKEGGWATEAAALAARTQFKQWVDTGMNAQQRAAQAESAAARSPAGLASLLRPPAPTRASGRRRAPDNCQIEVAFKVCGGNLVKVELAFVATLRSSSIDMNTLWLYRKRSAAAHERAAKRARGSAGDVCWDDLVARCRVWQPLLGLRRPDRAARGACARAARRSPTGLASRSAVEPTDTCSAESSKL